MSRLERILIAGILFFISLCAIHFLGDEYYVLLGLLDTIIGVVIGMVLFIPNNDGS